MRGAGGGQSHTIMLVIDMSDTAPASNTDTGSSEDKLWQDLEDVFDDDQI